MGNSRSPLFQGASLPANVRSSVAGRLGRVHSAPKLEGVPDGPQKPGRIPDPSRFSSRYMLDPKHPRSRRNPGSDALCHPCGLHAPPRRPGVWPGFRWHRRASAGGIAHRSHGMDRDAFRNKTQATAFFRLLDSGPIGARFADTPVVRERPRCGGRRRRRTHPRWDGGAGERVIAFAIVRAPLSKPRLVRWRTANPAPGSLENESMVCSLLAESAGIVWLSAARARCDF